MGISRRQAIAVAAAAAIAPAAAALAEDRKVFYVDADGLTAEDVAVAVRHAKAVADRYGMTPVMGEDGTHRLAGIEGTTVLAAALRWDGTAIPLRGASSAPMEASGPLSCTEIRLDLHPVQGPVRPDRMLVHIVHRGEVTELSFNGEHAPVLPRGGSIWLVVGPHGADLG